MQEQKKKKSFLHLKVREKLQALARWDQGTHRDGRRGKHAKTKACLGQSSYLCMCRKKLCWLHWHLFLLFFYPSGASCAVHCLGWSSWNEQRSSLSACIVCLLINFFVSYLYTRCILYLHLNAFWSSSWHCIANVIALAAKQHAMLPTEQIHHLGCLWKHLELLLHTGASNQRSG